LFAAKAEPAAEQTGFRQTASPIEFLVAKSESKETPSRAVLTIGRGQDIVGSLVSVVALQRPPVASIGMKGSAPADAIPRSFPLRSGVLTSTFGMRKHPIFGGERRHGGVDLAAPAGAPVFATGRGIVVTAGWAGGYGLLVTIDHGGGKQSRYGHLSAAAVSIGQIVPTGTVVGFVGSSGLATGPHLHYEIRLNGAAVDPTQVTR
jgi:murein DD-endopeptidase MepM/ murein hydrolase activator NlpD